MKTATSIAMLLAVCSCVSGLAAHASEEVLIEPGSGSARGNADAQAINACLTAFVNRILPDAKVKVRTVIAGQRQIFNSLSVVDAMNVSMTAQHQHETLASGTCTVNRAAKVSKLSANVVDSTRLAGLSVKELKLAAR